MFGEGLMSNIQSWVNNKIAHISILHQMYVNMDFTATWTNPQDLHMQGGDLEGFSPVNHDFVSFGVFKSLSNTSLCG